MSDQTPTPNAGIDVEKRVGQYVRLRDLKAEIETKHEEELAPVKQTMIMIEEELKTALSMMNATNMKTAAGTVSLSHKGLCADCHRLARDAQHNRSEQSFWHELGINPLAACVRLYAQRGDMVAMRAVVLVTIAERSRP